MKKFIKPSTHLLLLFILLIITASSFSQTAPVTVPKGGFKIDGQLRANTPGTSRAGDWVPQVNGTAFSAGIDSFVLSSSGISKDGLTTKLQRDLYSSNNDDVFTQGSKFNDYISALHWGLSGAPNKNDIHNGMFHASGDGANQWVFIGGDRLDVAGTSYIDFQFLQGTVVPNTTTNSTFIGSGPAGGRTVSDINVSMEYNNGGTAPKVVIYRWAPTNEAGTAWGWDSTGSANITQAYAKTNLTTVDVPFGGFGTPAGSELTYQPYAFVEAAINVTQLITAIGGNCGGLSIKTLWITTKASSSSTAALKDFITPISLDLNIGGVTIDQKGPLCALSSNITLTASPSGGTFSGTGVVNGNQFSPTDAGVGTHTISYVASAGVNCTKTATMDIVVNPLPNVTVNSPTKCANAANVSVIATPGSGAASDYNYSWSVPAGASAPGNVSSFTTGIAGNYTVVITNKATGCVSPPGIGLVTVNPNPTVTVNTTAICASSVSALMTASPSGGTPGYTSYVWSVPVGQTNPGSVASFNATVAGNYSVVVTDSKSCPSAAGSGTLTINANPTVTVNTTAICGSGGSATMTASPSGGTGPFTYAWSVPGGQTNPGSVASFNATVAGNYSVVITDSKSCSSPQGSGSLAINSNPDAPTVSVINPNCSVTLGSITVTAPLGTYQYSYNSGSFTSSTGPFNFAAGAGYSIVAKNTNTGCVSAATSCAGAPGSLNNSLTNNEATARNLGSATIESSVTVKAMPNPFSNQVRFVINSTEQGEGTLDIYNMLGQKIKTIYKGNIPAGASYFDLKLPAQSRNLVYVLKINDQQISGKLTQMSGN